MPRAIPANLFRKIRNARQLAREKYIACVLTEEQFLYVIKMLEFAATTAGIVPG